MTPEKDSSTTYTKRGRSDEFTVLAVYRCDNCQQISLALVVSPHSPHRVGAHQFIEGHEAASVSWLPTAGTPRSFDDVPQHLASAASEAHECNSIGAYRAAIALTRSVLEATAKDQGYTSGNLVSKIDQMHSAGIIRTHIKEVAHEIRHLGNDMAHGDFVDPVSAEESEMALVLMGEVLSEVYQSPARVARVRAVRAAKQQATSTTP